jgi:hypothetical protein
VLFVNAADRRKEKAAVEALCRHSPHAVTVHEIAARPA